MKLVARWLFLPAVHYTVMQNLCEPVRKDVTPAEDPDKFTAFYGSQRNRDT